MCAREKEREDITVRRQEENREEKAMTGDQPLRERSESAAVSVREAVRGKSLARSGEITGGGDPACWAIVVCQECGQ